MISTVRFGDPPGNMEALVCFYQALRNIINIVRNPVEQFAID